MGRKEIPLFGDRLMTLLGFEKVGLFAFGIVNALARRLGKVTAGGCVRACQTAGRPRTTSGRDGEIGSFPVISSFHFIVFEIKNILNVLLICAADSL